MYNKQNKLTDTKNNILKEIRRTKLWLSEAKLFRTD